VEATETMHEDLTKPGGTQSLTDLPGIGAAKARWLGEVGVHSVADLRDAPIDTIAHVRGVGYVLAERLKELAIEIGTVATDDDPVDNVAIGDRAEGTVATAAPNGDGEASDPAEATEEADLARWRERLAETQAEIRGQIAELLASPADRSLSPKFVKRLRRLHDLVLGRPAADREVSQKARRRISKHVAAIRTLLDSAARMDSSSREHQKVLRKQLRSRCDRLAKYV
jgi:hypothetical protein